MRGVSALSPKIFYRRRRTTVGSGDGDSGDGLGSGEATASAAEGFGVVGRDGAAANFGLGNTSPEPLGHGLGLGLRQGHSPLQENNAGLSNPLPDIPLVDATMGEWVSPLTKGLKDKERRREVLAPIEAKEGAVASVNTSATAWKGQGLQSSAESLVTKESKTHRRGFLRSRIKQKSPGAKEMVNEDVLAPMLFN